MALLKLGDLIKTPLGWQPVVEIEVECRKYPAYYTQTGFRFYEDELNDESVMKAIVGKDLS